MALKTQAQLIVESNLTYVDNTSGSITPQGVRTFNNDFISSAITADLTASMNVSTAQTASFLLGSIASASFAQNAATASYLSGTIASASYALNASTASYVAGLNSASYTPNAIVTASGAGTTITFTKGDSTTFAVTLSQSGSVASASYAANANLLDGQDSTTFATTASNNFTGIQTIGNQVAGGALKIGGDIGVGQYGNYYNIAANGASSVYNSYVSESAVFNIGAVDFSAGAWDTELWIEATPSQLAFKDWNGTGYGDWMTIQTNSGNTNPAPQFTRGLGITGSLNALNGITGSLFGTASYVQVAQTASYVNLAQTASYVKNAVTASWALNADLLDGLNSTAFITTSSFFSYSSSVATRFTDTPSLSGNNTFAGNNVFGNVTASNALITSASVLNLTVIYETASVIYSSGSNQFGDASNDVQTLWGTVTLPSGPLLVTGSVNASAGFTGSLSGNATTATTATTASYVLNAVSASRATSAASATTAATASSVGPLVQAVVISGSLTGLVTSASIASNTSSLDFSLGNFYTSLVTGTTNFNITNPKVGQTVNVLLTTAGTSASASFSSNVKQVSGSSYAPTPTTAAKDILTFISWDGTTVYLANVKNLI